MKFNKAIALTLKIVETEPKSVCLDDSLKLDQEARSYFVSTVGLDEDVVMAYIREQEKEEAL